MGFDGNTVAKDAPVEAGLHPVADRLIVSSTAITRGSLMGKGRFGEVLEGFVIGQIWLNIFFTS